MTERKKRTDSYLVDCYMNALDLYENPPGRTRRAAYVQAMESLEKTMKEPQRLELTQRLEERRARALLQRTVA